ncbi:MAG: hypothetical protein AB7Q00_14595 [Phycisphaerales bacterium]
MKESLADMFDRGMTARDIALQEKLDYNLVCGVLDDSGRKPRDRKKASVVKWNREAAFKAIRMGATHRQAGLLVGASEAAVQTQATKHNVIRFETYAPVIMRHHKLGLVPDAIRYQMRLKVPVRYIRRIIEKHATVPRIRKLRSDTHDASTGALRA